MAYFWPIKGEKNDAVICHVCHDCPKKTLHHRFGLSDNLLYLCRKIIEYESGHTESHTRQRYH